MTQIFMLFFNFSLSLTLFSLKTYGLNTLWSTHFLFYNSCLEELFLKIQWKSWIKYWKCTLEGFFFLIACTSCYKMGPPTGGVGLDRLQISPCFGNIRKIRRKTIFSHGHRSDSAHFSPCIFSDTQLLRTRMYKRIKRRKRIHWRADYWSEDQVEFQYGTLQHFPKEVCRSPCVKISF